MMRLSLVAAMAILVAHSPASAQTTATRRAREAVAIINSATPKVLKAYVDSAFGGPMRDRPTDAYVNLFMGLRERSGGLEWVSVQEESPYRAVIRLTRKLTGETNALQVSVEETSPHRVTRLDLRPPPGAAPRVASDAELTSALQQYVTALARADAFSGSVLLAKDGKVLYSAAFGSANKDFAAPNTIETKFNLGSMNKMFTSVVIAQLVDQGKLSYDDPLSKFVPDFPSAAAAQKVKIKHLLTHTSGLGSYFNDEFFKSSRERFRTVDDMMQLAKGESLAFEPGTRWSYSNTGMLVLGKVIEVVTKQDYFDYVRDQISKPAGMTRSDAYELDGVNENLAVGYEKEYADDGTKRYRNNIFMHVMRGGPAGGGYSTAPDLLRFAEALKSGKLITPATYELMTTPKPDVNSPRYGFGFQVDPQTGIVGHSGGFPGISSNLDIFKGTGYVAVVMANYGDAGQPVVDKIRSLVRARTTSATQ
ncbi:MAG TPA: serine hydrolase domain-containing protein [Gemmatimonadaceae bacterium]